MSQLRVEMIGGFTARMNGRVITDDMWPGRRSAELVQLLALARGHRLPRDQVMEALWPHLDADAAAANLRKAAHHGRRTLGATEAVVLRKGMVALLPTGRVETDFEEFEVEARAALAAGHEARIRRLLDRSVGDLLPGSMYEEWSQPARRRLETTRIELSRSARVWEMLIELAPTDESGYRELMRDAMAAENRAQAIHWYGKLSTVLASELSISPGPETEALYRECIEGLAETPSTLIGRQSAIAVGTSAICSASRTRVTCLLVSGETGIGKTRLTLELSELARVEGWKTFTTNCRVNGHPYEPLVTLVELATSSVSIASVPESARETIALLMSDRPAARQQIGRHRVAGALQRVFESIVGDDVLVVFDDLHLADEGTIDVLFRELALGSLATALMVLVYDPRSVSKVLADGIAALKRSGRSTEIDLEPLSDKDTEALVHATAGSRPSEETVARAVQLAQGIPSVAVELARSIGDTGELRVTSSVWDAALGWTENFDEVAVAMTERLALSGGWLSTDEVLAITGLGQQASCRLLDRLMDAGVLEVTDGRYRFRRELTRRALCNRVHPHRQLAVHRDVARRLQSHTTIHPQRIAHHWLQGGRPDEATPWLLAAAKHALTVGALVEALRHAEGALSHEPSNYEALLLRADALAGLGRVEAIAAYAKAAASADEYEAHEVKARLALTQLKAGDPRGALQTLEAVTPATLDGRIAEALTLSGAAAIGFGDPGVAAVKAGEARRLAMEDGDAGAMMEASWALSLAAHARGALRSSIRSDLVSTGGLGDLAIRVFDGYLCATERLLYGSLPYEEIVQFASSLRDEAERIGAVRGQGFALTLAGEARLLAGHLDAAASDLEQAVDLNRRIGATAGEALALQRRAEVDRYLDRPEDARPLLARALLVARESYLGHHLFDRIYGAMITVEEDPRRAMYIVEEAEKAVIGPLETCPACRITFEVPAAIASARFGDIARADRHLETVDMLSTVMVPQPGWHAAAKEARGHLTTALGGTEQASMQFARAAELYRAAGQPLDATRCQELSKS